MRPGAENQFAVTKYRTQATNAAKCLIPSRLGHQTARDIAARLLRFSGDNSHRGIVTCPPVHAHFRGDAPVEEARTEGSLFSQPCAKHRTLRIPDRPWPCHGDWIVVSPTLS